MPGRSSPRKSRATTQSRHMTANEASSLAWSGGSPPCSRPVVPRARVVRVATTTRTRRRRRTRAARPAGVGAHQHGDDEQHEHHPHGEHRRGHEPTVSGGAQHGARRGTRTPRGRAPPGRRTLMAAGTHHGQADPQCREGEEPLGERRRGRRPRRRRRRDATAPVHSSRGSRRRGRRRAATGASRRTALARTLDAGPAPPMSSPSVLRRRRGRWSAGHRGGAGARRLALTATVHRVVGQLAAFAAPALAVG